MPAKIHKHLHSPYKRALFSFILLASVMGVGTIGLYKIEGMPLIDAFYFMSMIASGEGPTDHLATSAGKIFVSIMAFISVGAAITCAGFLFGPFLGQLWRMGVMYFEEEMHHLKNNDQQR